MTTQHKTNGSTVHGSAGYAVAGVGAGSDLPSFWIALCRYRERHDLIDPQNQHPVLDDNDLRGLRATDEPRASVSFDDDEF